MHMKILLAEDDVSTRKGIEVFLKNQKHEVTDVGSGSEALKICLRKNPDLIISDVKMPELGGLERGIAVLCSGPPS